MNVKTRISETPLLDVIPETPVLIAGLKFQSRIPQFESHSQPIQSGMEGTESELGDEGMISHSRYQNGGLTAGNVGIDLRPNQFSGWGFFELTHNRFNLTEYLTLAPA